MQLMIDCAGVFSTESVLPCFQNALVSLGGWAWNF